jgi:hypothetical protein
MEKHVRAELPDHPFVCDVPGTKPEVEFDEIDIGGASQELQYPHRGIKDDDQLYGSGGRPPE